MELASLLPAKLEHSWEFERWTYSKKSKKFITRTFKHTSLKKVKKKYISFSLFNANLTEPENEVANIYLMGTLQNVVMKRIIFKDWDIIIYIDRSSFVTYTDLYKKYIIPILTDYPETIIIGVDWRTKLPKRSEKKIHNYLDTLYPDGWSFDIKNVHGWDLALLMKHFQVKGYIETQFAKTVYRFIPGGYNVAFASRDADARINIREEIAMSEWIQSTFSFCRLFDNQGHANPLMGGMWCAKTHCSDVMRQFNMYGSCKLGDVPIPHVQKLLLDYLSDRENFARGYGIDEAFLAQIDNRLSDEYHDNVLTFGKGSYYSGGGEMFSLLDDTQNLKIGRRLMTLMPAGSMDNVHGSHKSENDFVTSSDGTPMYGTECYFIGEDLPMKGFVSVGIRDWLIYETLNWKHATKGYFTSSKIKALNKRFGISLTKTFMSHLRNMTLGTFQDTYGWDKRILPHFWYTFLSGTNESIPFFEAMGSFNPNDYEVTLFIKANTISFLNHEANHRTLLQRVSTVQYDDIHPKIVKVLMSERSNLKYHGVNLYKFFKAVREYVIAHSKVYARLSYDEKEAYWEELTSVYPFTALRKLGQ